MVCKYIFLKDVNLGKNSFILTKWFVNMLKAIIKKYLSYGFILTKWFVNLSCVLAFLNL